jgi:hypothetical protein
VKNVIDLRPLTNWICVQPLGANEVKEIEQEKEKGPAQPQSLIFVVEPAARAFGEEMKQFRWCRVLSVHDGYEDVKPGDVVFCNVISGSQGINDQFQSINGHKFLQMPTKDVMGVLEQ